MAGGPRAGIVCGCKKCENSPILRDPRTVKNHIAKNGVFQVITLRAFNDSQTMCGSEKQKFEQAFLLRKTNGERIRQKEHNQFFWRHCV